MSRAMQFVLGVAALLLFQPTAASAKDVVERPMIIWSDIQNVLHLSDFTWDTTESGVCTHGGRFISMGSGFSDPFTGYLQGDGVLIVANGDQLNWHVEGWFDGQVTTGVIYLVGGTGRFEQAYGTLTVSYQPTIVPMAPDVLVATASYVATGTIQY